VFGSAAVDVVVGLIFLYFLLSVICAQINEWIAGIFDLRAHDLRRGLDELLTDRPIQGTAHPPSAFADAVWTHPLLEGLWPKRGKRPSYIPAATFALAVFDALAPGGDAQTLKAKALELAPTNNVGRALAALIDAAPGVDDAKVAAARANVADWFDAAMTRVSGVYKRRTQWVTVLVATFMTLLVGVDSIAVANAMWMNQEARAAISAAASSATADQGFDAAIDAISSFDLPLGWSDWPMDAYGWGTKIVGLILTTLAVCLGAPFWFDLLNRITNLRAAGPAPRKPGAEPASVPALRT